MKPELFTFKDMRLDVATNGKSQGKTSSAFFCGKKVKVATDMDKDGFADLVLQIFRAK